MKRKLILFLFFAISASIVNGQSVQILQFKETTFDFGTVKEEDGPVDHEFTFVNVSDRPILIRHVKASCGCTTPGWSLDTIRVGETGFVKARYDPRGRPGPFNKNLTVTSVPIGPPVRLYIKGNVTPRPRSIVDEYPVAMGKLRSRFRILNMGRIKLKEEPTSKQFDIYNETDSVVTFHNVLAPEHVTVSFVPAELGPRGKGKIDVSYDAMKLNSYGFQNENVTFTTSADSLVKSFSLYTNIEEYFPPMSQEELAAAPLVTYDKVEHDFGRVAKNSIVKTTFTIKNDGKKDLIIRKAESNCACIQTSISSDTIKPGESAELEVEFNTRSRRSNQQKAVTVYANSPTKPISRVIVKAYVESN